MLRYEDQEIANSKAVWLDLIHPNDRQQVENEINAHLDGSTTHYGMEHRMVQKDGTIRWLLSRGVAVRDDQDKPYRLIGCSVDITEYKQIED